MNMAGNEMAKKNKIELDMAGNDGFPLKVSGIKIHFSLTAIRSIDTGK